MLNIRTQVTDRSELLDGIHSYSLNSQKILVGVSYSDGQITNHDNQYI
jgi:hypothetical protein